jgi:hypothetical protein
VVEVSIGILVGFLINVVFNVILALSGYTLREWPDGKIEWRKWN